MKKKSSAEVVQEGKSKVGESARTLDSARELTAQSKEIVEQSKANAQMKKRTSSGRP